MIFALIAPHLIPEVAAVGKFHRRAVFLIVYRDSSRAIGEDQWSRAEKKIIIVSRKCEDVVVQVLRAWYRQGAMNPQQTGLWKQRTIMVPRASAIKDSWNYQWVYGH